MVVRGEAAVTKGESSEIVCFISQGGCNHILQQIRVTSPLTRSEMMVMIEVAGIGKAADQQQRAVLV